MSSDGSRKPTSGKTDVSYLLPLFSRTEMFRQPSGDIAPLPAPQQGSSLAAEDIPLQGWNGSTLLRSSVTAGVSHVDALNRAISAGAGIDAFSPWTLLRGALENFATAAWIISGADRQERIARAIALWAEDLRNRAQHEDDIGYTIGGPAEKSGRDRREEIIQRGESLGIARSGLPSVAAGKIIFEAAESSGLDGTAVRASWRAGSGFAHGRYWPNLRVSQARAAQPTQNGYLLAFVIDDQEIARLASACDQILDFTITRYRVRSVAP